MHYSVGKPCQNGHPDKRLVSNGACCECLMAKTKRWRIAHGYDEAEYKRDYRQRFPHKQKEVDKRYRAKHREKIKAAFKKWKDENREHLKATARIHQASRRARVKAALGKFTLADIQAIYERQRGACAVCPSSDNLHIDHIMPLALGGSNYPSNLQLLCQHHNQSKGAKHPDAWLAELCLKLP